MQNLKRLFDFYIFSNIHVAVAMFSFAKISLLNFGIDENITPLFVFFSTIISYNFIRSYKLNEINTFFAAWISSHQKLLIILNILSTLLLAYLTFRIRFISLLVLFPFIMTTFFYIVPFSANKRNLRSIAGLKLFLIALTGAGVTVLFPLSQNEIDFDLNVWIIFFQRLLFIIAYTIPFDIHDMEDDHIHLKTMPQLYGVNRSKVIGSVSLLIFLILEFTKDPVNRHSVLQTAILSLVTLFFLLFTRANQSRYYTTFWIEALPIFWLLILIL
ncbi:MAG: hypothetical protein DSY82_00020 [Flavobacteriia bacterium]|nr:MAG: hypothetical protein DSY82_00020 [Flavobacteriia bacterium]